jgi:hypothetical protein
MQKKIYILVAILHLNAVMHVQKRLQTYDCRQKTRILGPFSPANLDVVSKHLTIRPSPRKK